jgi:hypothetical protein
LQGAQPVTARITSRTASGSMRPCCRTWLVRSRTRFRIACSSFVVGGAEGPPHPVGSGIGRPVAGRTEEISEDRARPTREKIYLVTEPKELTYSIPVSPTESPPFIRVRCLESKISVRLSHAAIDSPVHLIAPRSATTGVTALKSFSPCGVRNGSMVTLWLSQSLLKGCARASEVHTNPYPAAPK